MICPKCSYVMDDFDKECPRCHGEGLAPKDDKPETPPPTPAPQRRLPAQAAPLPPDPYEPQSFKISYQLLFSVVVILAMAAAAYSYWIHSPEYSLYQIAKSVKTHDLTKFQRFVDTDAVLSSAFESMVNEVNADEGDDELAAGIAKGFMMLLKPVFVSVAKKQLNNFILTGNVNESEPQAKRDTGDTDNTEVNMQEYKRYLETLRHLRLKKIKREGIIALVSIKTKNPRADGKPLVYEFKMRKGDGIWTLFEWSNAAEVLGDIFSDEDDAPQKSTSTPPAEEEHDAKHKKEMEAYVSHFVEIYDDLSDVIDEMTKLPRTRSALQAWATNSTGRLSFIENKVKSYSPIPSEFTACNNNLLDGISEMMKATRVLERNTSSSAIDQAKMYFSLGGSSIQKAQDDITEQSGHQFK